jgi:hypothetical protein
MTTATTSKKEQAQLDIDYAREQLLTHYLTEGDTVYTVLRSVSSSGMSRTISLKVAKGGQILDLTYYASIVLGWKLVEVNGSRALRVGGCGMDMGFHTVYTLSSVLFKSPTAQYDAKSNPDAGYLLTQAWL